MAQRGKMLRDLANKKKSGSNESLDSSKKDFKTTSRQSLEVRKMSVNKMYSSLLKAGSKFTAPAAKKRLFGTDNDRKQEKNCAATPRSSKETICGLNTQKPSPSCNENSSRYAMN